MLVASGVSYRQLDAPGFAELTGAGIYYGAALTEARSCADQHVVIIGGANSAGQAAVLLQRLREPGDDARARLGLEKSMSHYLIEQIAALPNVDVRTRTLGGRGRGRGRPAAPVARARRATARSRSIDVDACFVFIGASPRTDWLDGVVARDERGLHPRRARTCSERRLAAAARPVPARDERARACSSPATCARARSSASRAPSARARWRSRSSTSTWSSA